MDKAQKLSQSTLYNACPNCTHDHALNDCIVELSHSEFHTLYILYETLIIEDLTLLRDL